MNLFLVIFALFAFALRNSSASDLRAWCAAAPDCSTAIASVNHVLPEFTNELSGTTTRNQLLQHLPTMCRQLPSVSACVDRLLELCGADTDYAGSLDGPAFPTWKRETEPQMASLCTRFGYRR